MRCTRVGLFRLSDRKTLLCPIADTGFHTHTHTNTHSGCNTNNNVLHIIIYQYFIFVFLSHAASVKLVIAAYGPFLTMFVVRIWVRLTKDLILDPLR
jgi:hypothetical protein